MKTNTYLRWSLLIPIFVWLLCLVVFVLATLAIPVQDPLLNEQPGSVAAVLYTLVAVYVFGIIVWIVPYLLLSLILFFSSFIGSARIMIWLYALSPLVMTALTSALMNIVLFAYVEASAFPDMPISSLQGYATSMLAMGSISLLWGYICVCIGYGSYKLLQWRGFIRDEQALELTPQPL